VVPIQDTDGADVVTQKWREGSERSRDHFRRALVGAQSLVRDAGVEPKIGRHEVSQIRRHDADKDYTTC
jgi:hypothetical protein